VYLLGAIFYEIFAGEPPHKGSDMHAFVTDILVSARHFPPSFPAEARRICAKALGREPAERFESAEALRLAIDEYLRHRGSRKLAHDAKQSLVLLQKTVEQDAAGEERMLAVANLLGECRFGYHAALQAWPDNEAARHGLDRALLLVVDLELADGNPAAAATLLREVTDKPADVTARVEAAVEARAKEDARLHRIEEDHDPTIGTRTRTFLSAFFGLAWTAAPLVGWAYARRVGHISYLDASVLPAIVFIVLGLGAFVWARETLLRTSLNRRLALTFVLYMVLQVFLGVGGWLGGVSPTHLHLFYLFAWGLTYGMLAVWAERWLVVPAATCAISFVVAAVFPQVMYVLMSLCNLTLTIVMVKVWFPRQDLARIHERRRVLRARARQWLRGGDPEA
jgi:serine/threonine-protein kinase